MGEVRVWNQYCVGPGSQIEKGPDGCDKKWCDRCADADSGYYRIADDRDIAVLKLEEFVEAVIANLPEDRDWADNGEEDEEANGQGGHARDIELGPGLPDDADADEHLEHALETDDKLRQL